MSKRYAFTHCFLCGEKLSKVTNQQHSPCEDCAELGREQGA